MSEQNSHITSVIIASILILLFFGITFLILISYFNNKKLIALKEKQILRDSFEKQLLQSQIEIQEQIFNSISEEIHDNVGQNLGLAKVQISLLTQKGVFNTEGLLDVKESISRAIAELRDIAKSLSSQRIQQLRIDELINYELDRLKKIGLASTSFEITGIERELNFAEKLILFRMVQESLQNIVKHANAKEIKITIAYLVNHLTLKIHDDGKGFDVNQATSKGNGLGLQNILNRSALIGGEASITSVITEGTCIAISIPLLME